jgi:threonine synthase
MTTYETTRRGAPVSLADAVFGGLAPDGGLYVPSELPRLPEGRWGDATEAEAGSLRAAARWTAPSFFPSVAPDVLSSVVDRALDFPVETVEVETGLFVLELFHGPTAAFKDVGARFMAALMPELESDGRERTVLVATSGDTGGAVASAFHGIVGYRVVVLFPRNGISERQRRQMTTLGGNVTALSVDGTFDDCQRMVKSAFADAGLRAAHGLTSANSINIARLLPQAFYYVLAALRLGRVHFVVPSGNLGNLCAGLFAARAGMPAAGFTAATNRNRGFADFLNGAAFEARPSIPTSSSAMDVGAPSNLERIRWLYGGDDDALRADVRGEAVSDEEVFERIRGVFRKTGYVMDPHTAVAYEAALRQPGADVAPRVILSTAHPAKFPETVEAAIGRSVAVPDSLLTAAHATEHMLDIHPTDEALSAALEGISA